MKRSPQSHSIQLLSTLLCVTLFLITARAQETGKGSGDLAAQTQNPVGNMIILPFEGTFDFGAPDGDAFILNIQPVIPIRVGDWNLINRIIVPVGHVPGQIAGLPDIPEGAPGDGATGLGDINYSLFVSPANPGKVIWGIGPSLSLPTATNDQLGSGKWSAGPTAVILAQPKPWSVGVLARQIWSFAGDDDRSDVNQFLLQPFVNYNFDQGWYLFSDPAITANWDAKSGNRWTVPLGGGAGRVFKIGEQAVNARLGAFYNVERPENAPDWAIKFTFQFLFPK